MASNTCLVFRNFREAENLFAQVDEWIQRWHALFDLFLLHDETLEDEESGITTAIWRDPARQEFEVRLVFDEGVPMIYLCIVPDDRSEVESLIQDIAQRFEFYDPNEIRVSAISNLSDVAAWTSLAISLSGAYDREIESVMRTQLSSNDPDQLSAAAMAASLLQWPELAAPLGAALARSIPENLRPALFVALQACSG